MYIACTLVLGAICSVFVIGLNNTPVKKIMNDVKSKNKNKKLEN